MKLKLIHWMSIFLALFLLLSISILLIFMRGHSDAEANEKWIIHTHRVIQKYTEVLSFLKDAETGQRGYLLTQNKSYLKPYSSGRIKTLASLKDITRLTTDSPTQQARLKHISRRIRAKLAELQQTIVLTQSGNLKLALKIVNTDLGKNLMVEIRQSIFTFINEEKRLLKKRNTHHRTFKRNRQSFLIFCIGLMILIILVSAYFLRSKIITPLVHLTDAATQFSKGLKVFEFKESNVEEVKTLMDSFVSMEKDIHLYIDELNKQKALSEQASREKSKFLANMSHEIRTPINGIYGSLQLLFFRSFSESEEYQDLVKKSIFACRSLLSTINDILDFSKVEAGKLKLESSTFNFGDILSQLIFTIEPEIEKKELSLNVVASHDFVDGWLGDSLRVQQICLNLLANSVKFTEQGEVSIHYKNGVLHNQPCLQITISDTGIGMSPETLSKIFNRFEQADTTTTRKYGGTGLGVTITKQLVNLMGGEIHVTSEESKGTTFVVSLPLEQQSASEFVEQKITTLPAPNLAEKTILLAEDNPLNQTIFIAMMKETNATIIVANNGKEATDFALNNKPDLVFMDIQMPVMSGIEAHQVIKQHLPKIPVVALTANVMEADVKCYKDQGFNGHLGKPIEMSELYRTIEKYTEEKS